MGSARQAGAEGMGLLKPCIQGHCGVWQII